MSLFIEKAGHGPLPLVLLHGWAMHGGVLAPLVEALEQQCTMYVVDLPGHGRSRDCGLPLEPHACSSPDRMNPSMCPSLNRSPRNRYVNQVASSLDEVEA
ncbi:MAG: alpha/beta fold hydrolase, partial [Rhodanobacter sp.]